MSMRFVVGLKPPDDTWRHMKAAYDACQAAGIEIPRDLTEFFHGEHPDDDGLAIDLEKSIAVSVWTDGFREGFEVDLSLLPEGLTKIRFYEWK